MPTSSHASLGIGLTLAVVVLAVPPLSVQAQGPNGSPAAAQSRPASGALRIGAIDMEKVFKEYKKVEFTSEQLKADAQSRQAELAKLLSEMQQLGKEMEGLAPGSNDFAAKESQITRLRAQLEAEREQAQADFARREADALAQIYREVQDASAAVAKANNMQYIVKISNEPVVGTDPNSVMAAMARSVIYSDPGLDITAVVIKFLNQRYDASGGTPAPADAAAQPASATQTAPRGAPAAAAPGGAPAGAGGR